MKTKSEHALITGSQGLTRSVRITSVDRGGQSGDQEVSLLEIGRTLRRRKWTLASFFVGALVLAVITILAVPKRFDATARLFLDFDDSDALGLEQLQPLTGLDPTTRLQTQMRILQSETLAWAVIKQEHLYANHSFDGRRFFQGSLIAQAPNDIDQASPELRAKLLNRFQKNLDVSLLPKTEIVEIRFRSSDPQLAARVVNALSSAYIERRFKTKYEATIQASDWLTQQLDDLKRRAEESQAKLAEYQKQTGLLGTDEVNNVVMSKLGQLNEQLSAAQGDRILREAKYRSSLSNDPHRKRGCLRSFTEWHRSRGVRRECPLLRQDCCRSRRACAIAIRCLITPYSLLWGRLSRSHPGSVRRRDASYCFALAGDSGNRY